MQPYTIIAAAVFDEVSSLIGRIDNAHSASLGGRNIVSGYIGDKHVKIIVTGPGIANTVQALTAAVENARPALIIQTGCGGAFKEAGLATGDIGIATEEIDIYLGIEPESKKIPLMKLPFAIIKNNKFEITNRYPVNNDMVNNACDIIKNNMKIDNTTIKKGPFVTVSTITATDERAKKIFEEFMPCMENMEGTGAAHTAIHYGIPFLEIRSASNIVGKRNPDSWKLDVAFEKGSQAVYQFIRNFEFMTKK